jgi:hypothetical protein
MTTSEKRKERLTGEKGGAVRSVWSGVFLIVDAGSGLRKILSGEV